MNEKTCSVDRYLYEHFFETCTPESRKSINCTGLDRLEENYSWISVLLCGYSKCHRCPFVTQKKGFYYGKGRYSERFELQEYVDIRKVRSQNEFEEVCKRLNPHVKGIHLDALISDPSVFETFADLEFIVFDGHRLSHFWDTSRNPRLKAVTLIANSHFKSLEGLERSKSLESLQLWTNTSDVATHKFESLSPLEGLPELKEVILSANAPSDGDIMPLIGLPKLEYVWFSPNLFPMEEYARFEARKFKIYDEHGIYLHKEFDDGRYDIWPLGKGKRIMHTLEQKHRYLKEYYELMKKHGASCL